MHHHFWVIVRTKHGTITGQYRRAIAVPFAPAASALSASRNRTAMARVYSISSAYACPACGHYGKNLQGYGRDLPAYPGSLNSSLWRYIVLIRKIALMLLACAALLSQGCGTMSSGFSPMSQPGEDSAYMDELSRPSGG